MSHCLIKTVPTGKGQVVERRPKEWKIMPQSTTLLPGVSHGGVLVRGAEVCIFQEVNVAASVRALRGESALMTVMQSNSVVPSP